MWGTEHTGQMAHACIPGTGGKGGSDVQGQPQPHSEFKFCLEYMRPCLKQTHSKRAESRAGNVSRGVQGLAWDTVTFSPEDAKEKQKQRLKRNQGPKGQQTGRRQVILELLARMKEARCRVMIQPRNTGPCVSLPLKLSKALC